MGIGSVVASAVSQASIKKILRDRYREERAHPWLDDKSYLRVSSLSGMCPREEVICAQNLVSRTKVVEAELSMTFTHGHALHWGLQNKVLADTGLLYGVWKCVDCAKQYGKHTPNIMMDQELVRRPEKCDCGSLDFFYREQHFVNDQYRLGGHPDGFLVLPGMPGIGIFEGKSIGAHNVWKVKYTPDMGHVVQTQAYMWLTGLQWAKILYWNKGGQGLSALVEHTVERDEEAIAAIKNMITSIWDGLASGLLPERICAASSCERAHECSVRELCFPNG